MGKVLTKHWQKTEGDKCIKQAIPTRNDRSNNRTDHGVIGKFLWRFVSLEEINDDKIEMIGERRDENRCITFKDRDRRVVWVKLVIQRNHFRVPLNDRYFASSE